MLLPVPISQAVCNLAGTSKGRRQRPPGRFGRVAHPCAESQSDLQIRNTGKAEQSKTSYRDEELLWEVFRSKLAKHLQQILWEDPRFPSQSIDLGSGEDHTAPSGIPFSDNSK